MNEDDGNHHHDEHNEHYIQLEDSKQKFLSILPIPSAMLSVLGASIIIKMALQSHRRNNKWTSYTRLLVAMSLYDIQVSITFAAATFLRPHDTSTRIWAFGSDATCSTIGFLNTVGFSSFFYNGMLSFYFLLKTKFGFTNQRMATKVEPIMHAIAIGYPLLSAVVGLSMNMYGELTSGLSCWIKDVPINCGTGEGQTGEFCHSDIFAWLFYAIPTFVALICLCVNSIVLFRFIWKQTRPKPIVIPQGGTGTFSSSARYLSSHSSIEVKVSESQNGTSIIKSQHSAASATSSSCSKDENDVEEVNEDDADSIAHEVDKYADTEAEQQKRRMKLLGSQAFLFVVCYVMCNVWTGIMLLKESGAQTQQEEDEMMVQYYSIAVLQAFFYPLQGFCNMLIYMRPRYLSMRYGFPNESRFSVAKLAVLGEDNIDPNTNNNNHQNGSPEPSNPSNPRKGSATIASVVNGAFKEDNSAEFKQRALDAAHGADQADGISSAIPLPRNMISSLTLSSDEESSAVKDNDPRWGKKEENMDSKPRKSTTRFQPSLRPSQLEVISELSESIFESVISAPEPHNVPEPVSPDRSPESRWGTTNGRLSSDLPPTLAMGLDISDRTMRISNRFSSSSQDQRNKSDVILDAPALAPSRTPSDLTLEPHHQDSEDCSVISEASSVSVDVPIRPPTRRMSPTPSTSS